MVASRWSIGALEIAFEHGSIWGLKATPRQTALWKSISEDDHVLFYATSPVSGVIGYGVVRTKFKHDRPLWPHRIELDVEYCLPRDRWKTQKSASDALKAIVRGGFQPIGEELAKEMIKAFIPEAKPRVFEKEPVSLHDEIKAKLVEIGRPQKLIAESEYSMDIGRLDVVGRSVERAVPTYVYEIQIGGDLYHAIGKLKHAYDVWNSNICLVVADEDVHKARELPTGMFHEIRGKIKVVEAKKIDELLKRKKSYKDLEAELGIL